MDNRAIPAFCVLLLSLLLLPAMAGISPSRQDFILPPVGGAIEFTISNMDGEPVTFEIALAGEAAAFSSVKETEFTLPAGGYRKIVLAVSPPETVELDRQYFIDVVVTSDTAFFLQSAAEGMAIGVQKSVAATYGVTFQKQEPPKTEAQPEAAGPVSGGDGQSGLALVLIAAVALSVAVWKYRGAEKPKRKVARK